MNEQTPQTQTESQPKSDQPMQIIKKWAESNQQDLRTAQEIHDELRQKMIEKSESDMPWKKDQSWQKSLSSPRIKASILKAVLKQSSDFSNDDGPYYLPSFYDARQTALLVELGTAAIKEDLSLKEEFIERAQQIFPDNT